MRIMTYENAEVWPTGCEPPGSRMRLDGEVEIVTDPDVADFIIAPVSIYDYEHQKVDPRLHLPHLAGRERKHVWLEIADCYGDHKPLIGEGILFHCGVTREFQELHPRAISWAWPVEDLAAYMPVPSDGFRYGVCFQGWLSCDVRQRSFEACRTMSAHLQGYSEFYGYYEDTERGRDRRQSYLEKLQQTRVALCPRSILGVYPYRFWEAMSAGRVPALVCDDFVLPLADRIPYQDFCIFIAESDAHRAGQIIRDYLASHSDEEIVAIGRQGRHHWETWLDARKWPTTMRRVLEEMV